MTKFKVDRDPNGYNVVTLDAEIVTSAGAIISEMFATPFLAEKRMVIVKNLLSAKSVEARQQISDIIKNNRLPSSTVAVFWERAETYKNKDSKALLELLQKEKYQERFSLLTLSEAATWFRSCIESDGATIALGVPEVAVKILGADSYALQQLADQMVNYHKGIVSEIMGDDLSKFVEEKADNNIFALVDAIVAGQIKSALTMMREQYRCGEDEQYILGMLIRQFRIMIQVADMLVQTPNISADILAKQLEIHPFVIKKTIPLIKKFNLSILKRLFLKLAEFDIKSKTGQGNLGIHLDMFVLEMKLMK
ncbi:MAG: DNA polymerase III subunit delta [Candidatus Magasanikbacteria bacterium RIFCSPHIGHO2_01_FULL_41_23]|nr:MAG: DNA polymerase III subunit delta [Candidatus Magasanikbacteria bacterium RIFCSPHIGHO2_01_FULL_41_23]OGH76445.1 MAG: DNA polymerase III subunit delta [Candidatus Magasanikbacteria bacterium RIFCSPHIGHO2_12_FULL_41_16]